MLPNIVTRKIRWRPCTSLNAVFFVKWNIEEITFDIAESRYFLAENATKSFVAGLGPEPLGEITAFLQTP